MWTLCRLSPVVELCSNCKNPLEFSSMYMKWEDKRHINGNEGRNVSCKSEHVDWTLEGQFWVPKIDVWDTIELVRYSSVSVKDNLT